jgi:2-dehydropantoate 2-reductase
MENLKYAVIGTGALGGYYGGVLAKAGKDVHFLFHSDYEWVKSNGLRVDSVNGNFVLPQVNAYPRSADMPVCDVVLVCMKTTADALLPDLLKPILHPKTVVLLIQNGFGNESKLENVLPSTLLAGGLGFICSSKNGPGFIDHQDYGKLTLGAHSNGILPVLEQLCRDLKEAGVPAEISEDLKLSRWKKLVWNVPFNGLCVVLNATTRELMSHPHTLSLVRDLMFEVVHAANASGSFIEDDFVQAMLDYSLKMKPYAPSMKLDFDSHRPMEIEAIYSRTIDRAAKAGFKMCKVEMLKAQLEFLQK